MTRLAVRSVAVLGVFLSACGPPVSADSRCPDLATPAEPTPAVSPAQAQSVPTEAAAAREDRSPLGSLAEREALQRQWLEARLDRVLPELMRKHGVDLWIVVSREYNEDPVFFSLVPPPVMAARRRTILVFFDRGPQQGVERLALGGGDNGGLYQVYRDPKVPDRELWDDAQWTLLRTLVDERKPKKIAINASPTHAFADGLTSSQRDELEAALGPWRRKLVPAEALAVEYVSVRVPEMQDSYRRVMEVAHSIIKRAFSNEVIEPGVTTTADVQWWMREQVLGYGFAEWFPPQVDVQRRGRSLTSYLEEEAPMVIERGDVLHCDFGLVALGLATDTQHVGYVLAPGESDVPAGLKAALERGNRVQDIVMAHMKPGATGNEVLAASLAQMKREGIQGTIYSHPIGDHGHGAGPLVGLWDRQEGVPGRGDLPILPNTWFSIELEATSPVAEWDGQPVRAALEEDAWVTAEGQIEWVLPRQTTYHLVR